VFACGDQKVILTNVRAVPWKGVDFLIDVVARLPEAYVLVVIGEGPLLETWKQRAQDRGLASRVRFLGRVSREVVAEWNQAADVFVLPSGYEGYPHVVIEAV
jgi:rhamnosyl/mannosyltransferase